MARRTKTKAKDPDPDFKIFVDPSCLSAPMDEEPKTTTPIPDEDEKAHLESRPETEPKQEVDEDQLVPNESSPDAISHEDDTAAEDAAEHVEPDDSKLSDEAVEQDDSELLDEVEEPSVADVEPQSEDVALDAEVVGDESVVSIDEADDGEAEEEEPGETEEKRASVAKDDHETEDVDEDSMSHEHEDSICHEHDAIEAAEISIISEQTADPDDAQAPLEDESVIEGADDASEAAEESLLSEHQEEESIVSHADDDEEEVEDNDDTPRPTQAEDDEKSSLGDPAGSRRQSELSDRRTSLRTEALIQAAAKAVMAKIEKRGRASTDTVEDDGDVSALSIATHGVEEPEGSEATYDADGSSNASRRESSESTVLHPPAPRSLSGDDGGDSSSHQEPDDDDVFSDNHSARSSMSGSYSGGQSAGETLKSPTSESHRDSFRTTRSPRMSGVSFISGISQYEKDEAEFVPTTRDTPRVPFRTPSSVRALQMSSPTPSVFAGSTPRSNQKKRSQGGSSGFPTISRLGSPTVSAQYSPKGRTPTRFKPRQEAPLVLLHVTLLPLRWMWADLIGELDGLTGKDAKDGAQDSKSPSTAKFEPSVELCALRDAWRQLQDRVGDTVLERGILLPHPQNDYEILEERLLEALDLPLRRRARILECGHYIGPSNLSADDELSQDESEDEYRPQSRFSSSYREKRHWCSTCKGEIKYEDLGPGKIFRVKVYASNGLMKAGAWEACWKEMERVDIEVEPIVDSALHNELGKLAAMQDEIDDARHRDHSGDQVVDDDDNDEIVQGEMSAEPEHVASLVENRELPSVYSPTVSSPLLPVDMRVMMHASPLQPPPASALRPHVPYDTPHSSHYSSPARPATAMSTEPIDRSEARRLRDEERMREIYGDDVPHGTPHLQVPSHHGSASPTSSMRAEPTATAQRHPDSYIPPPFPRSPSEEAYERREARGQQNRRPFQSASLPELLLEVVKVLMRDPKNVAIAFLGVLAVFFMLRPAPVQPPPPVYTHYEANVERAMATPSSVVAETPAIQTSVSTAEVYTSVETVVAAASSIPVPVQEKEQKAVPVKDKERKVIRVVETVTETEPAVETIYETETIRVTVSAPAAPSKAPEPVVAMPAAEFEDTEEPLQGAQDAEGQEVPVHDEI